MTTLKTWTIEEKNSVCKMIVKSVGLDGDEFTRKDEESSYIRLYSESGLWLCVRVSNHFENQGRRQMSDFYMTIENSENPLVEFQEFCAKNNLTFKYGF